MNQNTRFVRQSRNAVVLEGHPRSHDHVGLIEKAVTLEEPEERLIGDVDWEKCL